MQFRIALACALVLFICGSARALIMVGKGNAPVQDNHWPAGALEVANLKCRVGWWEGPPFGGGEHCFQYRGNLQTFNDALAKFAEIKAPQLDVVVHEGPSSSDFLKDDKDPKANTRVDWTFTVWNPENWYHLYNSPNTLFGSDQPQFRKDVDPPRLDVYASEDGIDWSRVQVPQGLHITDERASANGYKPGEGAVIRGTVYDMITSKPVPAVELIVEKSNGQSGLEKVASAVGDADGRFELKNIPAGGYYATLHCAGYAPRSLAYVTLTKDTLKTFTTKLAPAVEISGTVVDPAGKPIADVTVRPEGILALDGGGYTAADAPKITTGADGRFIIPNLPKGRAQLFTYAHGWHQKDLFKVYELPAADVKIVMTATGAVKVKVLDKNGKPATQGNVSIFQEGGPKVGQWGGSANVKDDGTFQFDDVPPGKYLVSADPGAQFSKTPRATAIEVRPGETAEVEVVK